MFQNFYIVYPAGDRSKLTVVQCESWELSDYDVASRKDFIVEVDAINYAKELAKNNGLIYEGNGFTPDYLD